MRWLIFNLIIAVGIGCAGIRQNQGPGIDILVVERDGYTGTITIKVDGWEVWSCSGTNSCHVFVERDPGPYEVCATGSVPGCRNITVVDDKIKYVNFDFR